MAIMVDPPSGWLYGFPKVYDFECENKEDFETERQNWFVENGYPKTLINQGMLSHCRYFGDLDE